MAEFIWTNTAGGDFANGANWNQNGAVPGPHDDALLTTAGSYTVTSSVNETVNSLQMISTVTLDITGGTFYAEKGSGSGSDNGLIEVGNNTDFEVGGTIAGTGTIALNSGGNATDFTLNANTTLSGGGKLILGDNSNNAVIGLAGADLLTNTSDTISGAGQFGSGQMSFANAAAGVVNATGTANALVLDFGSFSASNAGLIEATGSAGLVLASSTLTQTGTGSLKAAGESVSLSGGVVSGGTLSSTGGATIQSINAGELISLTITAGSTVQALNNTILELQGTITNKGTLALNSAGNGTDLLINAASVTLTGAGKLVLSDNANNAVYGSNGTAPYDKLVNVNNTISGSGQLGNNQLSITNDAAGVIDATGTNAALVLDTGAGSFSNAGLIEDTGPAGLQINNGTTIINTGTIAAFGAGSHVDLYNANTTIQGGTLATSGGGVIQSTQYGTLDGLTHGAITITTGSQIVDDNNDNLYLAGAVVNAGTISLESGGNGTPLFINSATVTLSGGGALVMSDNINNSIEAGAAGNRLVNVNNVISGSGQIGVGTTLSIDNQAGGIIDSSGASGIALSLGAGSVFTNEGLVEGTGSGAFTIYNGTTIVNAGTVLANGAGSAVNLSSGALQGGTLETENGGVIQSVNIGTLDGATSGAITITAHSTVADDNSEYLYLDGSVVNHGTIALDSVGNGTDLWIQSPTVTLSGGGTVAMSDNGNNEIITPGAADTLVNVDNTIAGSGSIGNNGGLSVDNQAAGIIDSSGVSGLALNIGASSFTNEGLIEDTNTGGIRIYSNTDIVNAGTIAALGAGSSIDLVNADLIGGTLEATGGGVIQSVNIGTLDGSTATGAITITSNSQIADDNDEYLYLAGSIVNGGTIALNSGGNGTYLWMNSSTVTLSGGGVVLMSDNPNNLIANATGTAATLVNANNIIEGSGQIGYDSLGLINQASGTIDSNGGGGITFTTASFTNQGLLEDTNTGGIGLAGVAITNDSTIEALGAGSSISLYNGAVISGGTLKTTGGAVIQSTGVGTLDGSSNGALTIASASTIADQNDQYLYLQGSIVNDGTIALDSGGNNTILWSDSATVTLTGKGTVLMTDNGNNIIAAAAGGNALVNTNNTIEGSGQIGNSGLALDNQKAGVIDSNGAAGISFYTSSFTNEGTVEATSTGGIALQNITVVNTGTIAALDGSFVNLNAAATIAGGKLSTSGGGVIQSTYEGTLDGSTTAGAVTITAGSQVADDNDEYLYLKGGITNSGTIGVNSGGNNTILWVDSGTVTLSGAGSVVLTDNGNNYIQVGAGGDKLVNVGNTIAGAGQFGNGGDLLIDNQKAATIDATGGNNLNMNLGGGAFTNEGTAEGSGAGGLLIQNTTLTNTGTIAALSASSVTIASSATITNYNAGTLAGGTWEAIAATGATSTLALATGNITDDAATLLISGAGASITTSGTSVLTTIGTIATGGALLIEGGTTFDGGSLVDDGLLEANSKGTIVLAGGTFTNAGTLEALSGGTVELTSTETDTNLAAGKLSKGSWVSSGSGSLLYLAGGSITNDAAIITLSGAGSSITSEASGKKLEATLKTIAAGGQLNVLSSRGFASTSTGITDNGTIALGGGTFSDTSLAIAATGSFVGGGTLAGAVTDGGTVLSSATPAGSTGTLSLTGSVSGTGLLSAGASTVLNAAAGFSVGSVSVAAGATLNGAGGATGAVSVSGTLALGASGTLSAGSVTIAAGGTVSGAGIAASGAIADSGSIVLSGGTLSGGTITVAAAALLSGSGTVATSVANSGTIDATGGTLTLAAGESGGALAVAAGAALVSTVDAVSAAGLSLGAGGSFTGFGAVSGATASSGSITASGGTLSLAGETGGALAAAAGDTLTSSGAIAATSLNVGVAGAFSGHGSVSGATSNSGAITAAGGTLTLAGETGGALSVAASGELTATAAIAATSLVIAAGGSFIGSGSAGALTDTGSLTASGGSLLLATDSGSGTAAIASGATLDSTAALTLAGVTFAAGTAEVLALGTANGNTATITGFGAGTTIDLLNAIATTFTYNPSNGVLKLDDGTTAIGSLKFAGTYTKASFQLHSDGNNGTDILFTGVNAVPAVADLQIAAATVSGTPQAAGLSHPAPPAAGVLPAAPSVGAEFGQLGQTHALDTGMLHIAAVQ
jgi:hypothetical protein